MDTKMLDGVTAWGTAPSCRAVRADWGANVIKIEHPGRGGWRSR